MSVRRLPGFMFALIALAGSLCSSAGFAVAAEENTITFIVTSDSHYKSHKDIEMNDRNKLTIERMNVIQSQTWPEKLGGGAIGKPLGVLALGDLVDDGDKPNATEFQWKQFASQFGLDGTDGLLKYPVYEGWGNHDGPPVGKERFGFSVQAQLKARNIERKKTGRISNVSENGLHYSWDWGPAHFLNVGLIVGTDKQVTRKRRYAALGGAPPGCHPGTQRRRWLAIGGRQGGRAGEGRERQLACLYGVETDVERGRLQRLDQQEHIGRPATGNCGHRVDQRLAVDPDHAADRAQDALHQRPVGRLQGGPGIQSGHALPDQRRGIGHGARKPGIPP